MSFKTDNLYVQRKTKKRLWDVLSIYPSTFSDALKSCRSADDLGDKLINDAIDSLYPEEKALRKAKDKAEAESAQRIRGLSPELEVNGEE